MQARTRFQRHHSPDRTPSSQAGQEFPLYRHLLRVCGKILDFQVSCNRTRCLRIPVLITVLAQDTVLVPVQGTLLTALETVQRTHLLLRLRLWTNPDILQLTNR